MMCFGLNVSCQNYPLIFLYDLFSMSSLISVNAVMFVNKVNNVSGYENSAFSNRSKLTSINRDRINMKTISSGKDKRDSVTKDDAKVLSSMLRRSSISSETSHSFGDAETTRNISMRSDMSEKSVRFSQDDKEAYLRNI